MDDHWGPLTHLEEVNRSHSLFQRHYSDYVSCYVVSWIALLMLIFLGVLKYRSQGMLQGLPCRLRKKVIHTATAARRLDPSGLLTTSQT